MTGPAGLLNFFVAEATEYLEQLDALLQEAGPAGPDADGFTRAARALRGSATMAKLTGLSALAASVERLGRALRERALPWTPAMREALETALGDLRALVEQARSWGPEQERRAQARVSELLGFAPVSARATSPTPISTSTGALFVVNGATDVAAALTAAVSRPGNPELLGEALRRLRGFRGVAALRDFPPLPAVLDATERVARSLEQHAQPLPPSALTVLTASARHLRRMAEDIRAGGRPDAHTSEARAYADATAAHEAGREGGERIVPIASLAPQDGAAQLVRAATAPSTTAFERFRLESGAMAEHVRRLVGEARLASQRNGAAGHDAPHAGHAVARAVHALRELAESFGHAALSAEIAHATDGVAELDPIALLAADAVAALLVAKRDAPDVLRRRVSELASGRAMGSVVAVGLAPIGASTPAAPLLPVAEPARADAEPARVDAEAETEAGVPVPVPTPPSPTPTPTPTPTPVPEPIPTPFPTPFPTPVPTPEPEPEPIPAGAAESEPAMAADAAPAVAEPSVPAAASGRALQSLLADSLAGMSRLEEESLRDVVPLADRAAGAPGEHDADVVPVETLLYRGRAALGRAIELRDEIRRHEGSPPGDKLDELFEMLDLAALT